MGIGATLADFGLINAGFNTEMDAQRARANEEADRRYLESKRAQERRMAQAAEEAFNRDQAYQAEMRTAMAEHMAGGAKALPAEAAVEGQVFDARQAEGGDVPLAAQPAKPARDNVVGMNQTLQGIAAKYGKLKDFEETRARLKRYEDEGVLDFIAKARQGASEAELIDAFNRRGGVKLAGLRKVGDGRYAGVTTDKQPVEFDLNQLTESLLAPKEYLAHADRAEKTAAQLEATRARVDASRERLASQEQAAASNAGLREARIALMGAQADAARARADKANSPKPVDWNKVRSGLVSAARDEFTTQTDSGKRIDQANAVRLSSMAYVLTQDDPDRFANDLPGAITEAKKRLQDINEMAAKAARDEAAALEEKTKRTFLPDRPFKDVAGKPKKRFIEDRTAEIVDQKLGRRNALTATADASSGAPASAAPAAPKSTATGPVTGGETPEAKAKRWGLKMPQSQEEFDNLEPGVMFVNPADGRILVK